MANPVCDVLLTEEALLQPCADFDPGCGALVDFQGIVRPAENGLQIDGIDYEAHRPMAEHQMRLIAQEAIEKFTLGSVMLHHRIGFVGVGEASLFLRASSRHRGAAFAASEWIVDELKKKVPIWKHPRFKIDVRTTAESAQTVST